MGKNGEGRSEGPGKVWLKSRKPAGLSSEKWDDHAGSSPARFGEDQDQ